MSPAPPSTSVLLIQDVPINRHCVGTRWTVADVHLLARVIASVAMGQAAHAASIVRRLLPDTPIVDNQALRVEAKRALSITGSTPTQQQAARHHRDAFVFETISWAATQQTHHGQALIRDPHITPNTPGLDGFMIEFDTTDTAINLVTIFEDKCTQHPRQMFRDQVMPTFLQYHDGSHAREILATAAALLERSGLSDEHAAAAAAHALDPDRRAYRGSLTTTPEDDTQARRSALFDGYEDLDIPPDRRIGGLLVTGGDLRAWFDHLADLAVDCIDQLGHGDSQCSTP